MQTLTFFIVYCCRYIFRELSILFVFNFFLFKQKTAYEMRISDWSSDVCSSDLHRAARRQGTCAPRAADRGWQRAPAAGPPAFPRQPPAAARCAEERPPPCGLAAHSRRGSPTASPAAQARPGRSGGAEIGSANV